MSDTKISALTAATLPLADDWLIPLAKGSPDVFNRRAPAWALGAWYDFHEESSGAAGIEFEFPDEPFSVELFWSNVRWTATGSSHFGFDIWYRGAGAYSTANFVGAIARQENATFGSPSGLAPSPVMQTHRYTVAFDASPCPFSGHARLDCIASSQPLCIWGRSVDYELFSGSLFIENSYFWGSNGNPNPSAVNRVQKLRFRRADSANITGWFGVRRLL